MATIAATFHEILVAEIQQNYLAGESQLAAKQCLRALYVFTNQIANLNKEIKLHPYQVFRLLCDFYIEVCVYRDTRPKDLGRAYTHAELGPCFNSLLEQLEEQVQLTKTATPYTAFVASEGMQVCQLAEGAKRAKDIFWLVQKPRVAEKIDLGGLKLAARGRIQGVHQRALRGIPYVRIENPPFHHNFSTEVEFYAMTPGEEWDHAVREGAVAFYDKPELSGIRFFIYWRTD
jgi:type VI secretion system protein ImpJ